MSMYAEHIISFSYIFSSFNSFQVKDRQRNEVKQMLTVCINSSLNIRLPLHATYKPFLINSVSQPDAAFSTSIHLLVRTPEQNIIEGLEGYKVAHIYYLLYIPLFSLLIL